MLRSHMASKQRLTVMAFLAGLLASGVGTNALAADYFIPSSTSSFNGSSVKPGDTVTLQAGNRGPLSISNISGTVANPIIVRNDTSASGPTVIRKTSSGTGGFVFHCKNCVHVVIDGTGKWVGAPRGICGVSPSNGTPGRSQCGIKITITAGAGSPTAFLKHDGLSSNYVVRGVEVDGNWPTISNQGIGIDLNDHSVKIVDHPGVWREGIIYENNYVHEVEGEGFYIGHNQAQGGLGDLNLRNIEIAYNLVEGTGWDGIELKSATEGRNRIHHNIVNEVGLRVENDPIPGERTGISCFESTCDMYNNWVQDAGEHGIRHLIHKLPSSFGILSSNIYNNVVVSPGQTGPQDGKGVTVGRSGTDKAVPSPVIYNNTIINSEAHGIFIGSRVNGSGIIRDNIVAGAGNSAVSAGGNIAQINNEVGEIAEMKFLDADKLDFHLTHDSPARDAASASGAPAEDFDGVSRPQSNLPDQGAFEFVSGETVSRPNPPSLTQVQ